jgi:hypothetical protein
MTDNQHICVTVLGAGRSGTSLSTRGLAAVGVDLGDRLRRGWGKNPTGFFEDRDLLALNQRLKRTIGIRGDSVRLIAAEEYDSPAIEALRHQAIHTIRRRFGPCPLWGYKYGRTLRLMPFWEPVYDALDLDMRYLVAIRNPLSVAASRGKLDPRRGVQETADHEWLVNVVPHFARARGRPMAVVDYDRLMADPRRQLARMATGLALPDPDPRAIDIYCDEFLRPGMRHTRFSVAELDAGRVDPLVRDAYRWLDRLAGDEITADDPAHWDDMWDDWARIAAAVEAMGPALAATDQAETARRRAERGPRQTYQWLRRKMRGG